MVANATMTTKELTNALGTIVIDDEAIATLTLAMAGGANKMNDVFFDGLDEAVTWLCAQEGVGGVVVASGHKDFCVGADLDMLYAMRDKALLTAQAKRFHGVFRALETMGVPVVAALCGSALGGGFEIALACHRRIAVDSPRIQLGLPEVMFGVIPGAGGTQRLARLLGLQSALEHILQAKIVRAPGALRAGLVDGLEATPEAVMAAARAWVLANPKSKQPWDQRGFVYPGGVQPGTEDARNVFMAAAGMLHKKTAGAIRPPELAMSAIHEGTLVSFDAGIEVESRYFVEAATSDTCKDMIRTFWFHRQAALKHEGLPQVQEHGFSKVGILGAGMMGASLGFVCAYAGFEVVLKDIDQGALDRASVHCAKLVAKRARHMSDEGRAEITARIKTTLETADLAGCDLIVEAVLEDLDLKHTIIREVEPLLADGAVFASNTSALPISDLAQASIRPEAFIGLHFFSPVEQMDLLEIICGEKTSDETLARALAFTRAIKKLPIVVNDGYGFYTTRVFSAYILEGAQLVAEGHDPVLIERAAKQAGMVVSPLKVLDEVTLSLVRHGLTQSERYGFGWSESEGMQLITRMVDELGRVGKKAGGGFYDYGGDRRQIWPGLAELVGDVVPEETGVTYLTKRLMLVQCAEVVRCVDEGILRTHRDAEVGAIFGLGFAPQTGGPLAYMDRYGLQQVVADMEALAESCGRRYFPAPGFVARADRGERFFPEPGAPQQ